MTGIHAPAIDRLLSKVEKTSDGCWIWSAHRDKMGYGRFTVSTARRAQFAHRVAYELLIGEIPEGLELDHICRNPSCVNPEHLEPVPHRENLMRSESASAVNARKTRCPHGHAYDKTTSSGLRRCSTCDTASEKRRNQRRREARRAA